MEIPKFIVHYSRGKPFQTLSSLSMEDLVHIVGQLNESNTWGLARFSDAEYLPKRIEVERKIRSEFIKKGGCPELDAPLYFFLGRNLQFEEDQRNIGYRIPLSDLPKHSLSFTYGDSLFSIDDEYRRLKGGSYLSELCSRVYNLEDLELIFSHSEFRSRTRLPIEAQLWLEPPQAIVESFG